MNVLGISAFYHDSAAALIMNGEISAAAQEERFTRIKHDASLPKNAIKFCLQQSTLSLKDIDLVVFYEQPMLKLKRLLSTYVKFAPKGFRSFNKALPIWLGNKLYQKRTILRFLSKIDNNIDWKKRLIFTEHHLSHAASAFFPSPFTEAAILTLDGVGEWATTSIMLGEENHITPLQEIHFPHSLGLLYSAFTYYTGFKVNSGEYKLMGLAPYGIAKYKHIILDSLIDLKDDGSYRLNLNYFNYCTGLTMTNNAFETLFKKNRRLPQEPIEQFHMDIAASIQSVTETILVKIATHIKKLTGQTKLCLSGGVALNCVANGKLLRSNIFNNIWIQPASGDAGGALGAAYIGYHCYKGKPRFIKNKQDKMKGSYLGPAFSLTDIRQELKNLGANFKELTEEEILRETVTCLVHKKSIGWFQGKMEYGPRSLGSRSILADPRATDMQKTLNLKIKFRESFRPFAPAILFEYLSDWFGINQQSPYMLYVAEVLERHRINLTDEQKELFGIEKLNVSRSTVPAITHVNYSARIQTVHKQTNPKFHKLLSLFYEKTNCPILVNTSFNVRGEPIVCSPADAYNCFMGTGLDVLVIDNIILQKNEQNPQLLRDYKNKFKLD